MKCVMLEKKMVNQLKAVIYKNLTIVNPHPLSSDKYIVAWPLSI